jgi:large subunit ribosomal protein L37Ae
MGKIDKLSSAKRFGVRYGTTVKYNLAKVEKQQRAATKCPYCSYDALKRLAAGIFNCGKCGKKFTGKAYTTATIKPILEQKQEQVFDFSEEEEEKTLKYTAQIKKEAKPVDDYELALRALEKKQAAAAEELQADVEYTVQDEAPAETPEADE